MLLMMMMTLTLAMTLPWFIIIMLLMIIIIHLIMSIISGSDQEKFNILRFVTRKTVGAMRIVAFFCAGCW